MKKVLLTLALASLAALPVQAVIIPLIGTATEKATGSYQPAGAPYEDVQTGAITDGFNQTAQGSLRSGQNHVESKASQTISVTDGGFSINASASASALTIFETNSSGSAGAWTKLDGTFHLDAATTVTLALSVSTLFDVVWPETPLNQYLTFALDAVDGGFSLDMTDLRYPPYSAGYMPTTKSSNVNATYTTTLGPGDYHLAYGVSAGGVNGFQGNRMSSNLAVSFSPVPDAGSLVPALAAALGIVGVMARRMRR